jgi:hypothetical protein
VRCGLVASKRMAKKTRTRRPAKAVLAIGIMPTLRVPPKLGPGPVGTGPPARRVVKARRF